ncbi:hypothetical protein KY358_02055 [Candidatus Woesearchaeota archaeon]|nr:hypothetical protein [Candidatus Woesearchaeota archaeon]
MQPYFVMPTHLKEQRLNGEYHPYKINDSSYYPQQFFWPPVRYLDDILKGNYEIQPSLSQFKPNGIWMSGNRHWAMWCQKNIPKKLNSRIPLKAYLLSNTKICELNHLEDFINVCNQEGLISEKKLDLVLNFDSPIGETPFFQNLSAKGYSGIHLAEKALPILGHIFYGWDVESTVIFDKTKLKFKLLTSEELKELGWDHYKDIITLEDYKGRKKNNRPTPSLQAA